MTVLIKLLRNFHSSKTVISNGKELIFSTSHMRILVSKEATDIKYLLISKRFERIFFSLNFVLVGLKIL